MLSVGVPGSLCSQLALLTARFAHSSLRSQLASLASLDEDENTSLYETNIISLNSFASLAFPLILLFAPLGAGASMFIVDKGTPGFTLGQKIENKCGMRASMTAELVFDNVRVPKSKIVGNINGASICMMRNLEIERVVLAAMSVGIARRCLEAMTAYSGERNAFGQSLNNYGQIQKNIAESYAEFMAGKMYTYNTSNNMDLEKAGNVLDSDGVKLYCGVMGKSIADRAIQTMGGNGYVGEYRVEQLWRDSKLLEIGGGTNEAHHKNITNWYKKTGSLNLR